MTTHTLNLLNTFALKTTAVMRRCLRLGMAILLLAGFLFSALSIGNAALAQSAGGAGVDRTEIAKELSESHAEEPVGMGLAKNGGIIELFSSKDGDTWTLILTMPNGKSFLLSAGENWAGAPIKLKGQKI